MNANCGRRKHNASSFNFEMAWNGLVKSFHVVENCLSDMSINRQKNDSSSLVRVVRLTTAKYMGKLGFSAGPNRKCLVNRTVFHCMKAFPVEPMKEHIIAKAVLKKVWIQHSPIVPSCENLTDLIPPIFD